MKHLSMHNNESEKFDSYLQQAINNAPVNTDADKAMAGMNFPVKLYEESNWDRIVAFMAKPKNLIIAVMLLTTSIFSMLYFTKSEERAAVPDSSAAASKEPKQIELQQKTDYPTALTSTEFDKKNSAVLLNSKTKSSTGLQLDSATSASTSIEKSNNAVPLKEIIAKKSKDSVTIKIQPVKEEIKKDTINIIW